MRFDITIKTSVGVQNSLRKSTVMFVLESGAEKVFGSRYPTITVNVLPVEGDQVPLQISLITEDGDILNSTTVYYTPEISAEFSLDADGVEVDGQVSEFHFPKPE